MYKGNLLYTNNNMGNVKHIYVQLYTVAFKTIELFGFILPAIPSSIYIRLGILGLYFFMHSIGLQYQYKKWKQSILNQFDDRKEDSNPDNTSTWKTFGTNNNCMYEVDFCDIESIVSIDSPVHTYANDLSGNHDSDYTFVH
jgi:hypothetical protein